MADSGTNHDSARPTSKHSDAKPVIVGIGASAGGVQALQALFDELPDTTGAAFVVVVHLDPESHSELSRILAAWTRMPVVHVETSETLQPNHVYVIPPDRRLYLADSEVSAAEFDEPRGRRAPIDLFFRSLAEHGDGFAVVLTGAGSDGAVGVRAVKEAGGIILVQDPREAEYPSMPRSAIATGIADFILPVREIAARLVELVRTKQSMAVAEAAHFDEDLVRAVLAHLRVRTGHDFSKYKRSTVLRRIARRMQVARTDELKGYYEYLREHDEEARALLSELLISVTTFFRDGEAFEALKSRILPELFAAKEPSDAVRVWVPGCATGEEAYSIAILLLEEVSRHELRPRIQIFGSDLDVRALAAAREGRFPAAIEVDISEERLHRFFTREGDSYRVRQEVRDIVLFAAHDLLKDPPFSRLDLISCRNVLIYLDRELQEQVCTAFHYALNPGGILLLGSSESADSPPGLFRLIDRSAHIYQSTVHPGERPRLVPRLLGSIVTLREPVGPGRPISPSVALSEATSHRQALEEIAPPSILVDATHRVIHLSDNAGRYLQPAGGSLSGDVVDLARPELRFELRTALHRAFEQGHPTLSLPILVHFNGAPRRVHLQVKPVIKDGQTQSRGAVVLFIEGEEVTPDKLVTAGEPQPTDENVRQLTRELAMTQNRLRMVREESEATNEELRAANEELQSINEEYRSTSEELETSKEELQSINEELQTVNSELKLKLEAITRAHSDLQNLMAATDFGTLFLDAALRIKRFTDRVTELFNITQSDEGRPITDFAHQLEYQGLVEDARAVLANLAPIRREIRSRGGRWYDMRFRPYRTIDNKVDGVVITFVDITERRQMEEALKQSDADLRQERRLVELSRDPIFIWDFDGSIMVWNRGSEELYGYSRDEAIGKKKDQLLSTELPGFSFADLRAKLLAEGSFAGEVRHRTKDGRQLTVETQIVLETIDGRRLALESTRDITERKRWEERRELLLSELSHRVRNTLAVIQAVARHTLRHSTSKEDFVDRFEGRLAALANIHRLLMESKWKGADLGALVQQELNPYVGDNPNRLRFEGEPILLPADVAAPFGLVLHELATNAAKYGPLSEHAGRIDVNWTTTVRNNKRNLRLIWKEEDGPAVKVPSSRGFGTALIDTAIPGAVVNRDFRRKGLVCTIELALPEATNNGAVEEA